MNQHKPPTENHATNDLQLQSAKIASKSSFDINHYITEPPSKRSPHLSILLSCIALECVLFLYCAAMMGFLYSGRLSSIMNTLLLYASLFIGIGGFATAITAIVIGAKANGDDPHNSKLGIIVGVCVVMLYGPFAFLSLLLVPLMMCAIAYGQC